VHNYFSIVTAQATNFYLAYIPNHNFKSDAMDPNPGSKGVKTCCGADFDPPWPSRGKQEQTRHRVCAHYIWWQQLHPTKSSFLGNGAGAEEAVECSGLSRSAKRDATHNSNKVTGG
jgi:hypothetical protein